MDSPHLEGPDSFANYPPRAGAGRAYPRDPVERGAWQVGQSYQPGDVVSDGTGLFLCVAPHLSSAELTTGDVAHWQPYRGEVNYSAYWDPEHAVMIWPTREGF